MEPIRQALRLVDQTQASITASRKLLMSGAVDPETVMKILRDEFRRLSLFYVFNDVVQYAARSQLTDYLEYGSSLFLPEVGASLERVSVKDRNPYVRTLSIWEERRVFSSSFISRIRTHWERQVSESTASSEDLPHKIPQSASKQSNLHRTSVGSGLLRGDAKLVDTSEIAGRLANQVRISNDILERLSSRSGESEKEWIQISLDIPRIDGTDHIQALRSSLSVELMDLSSFLLAAKASLLSL